LRGIRGIERPTSKMREPHESSMDLFPRGINPGECAPLD
jgi:hypothetical protein